jgi:hypothetical protein
MDDTACLQTEILAQSFVTLQINTVYLMDESGVASDVEQRWIWSFAE